MNIQKANRLTLVEQVTAQMEQLIESGEWKVGDKLPPEPALMACFDVSRNTLREAINSLVHTGLVEKKQGIGTTVIGSSQLGMALQKKVRKLDLLDTLEVRLTLEREAAQLAALRRTSEDLQHMEEQLRRCQEAAEMNDPCHFSKMDTLFHKAVIQATHNSLFIELYESITDSMQHSILTIMSMKKSIKIERDVHIDLFEAIHQQNAVLAMDCVTSYMEKAKTSLSMMLEEE
ncbi:GntR family transcriptional regulator [Fictibacillus macauensis ZFHKF-1]|uniref:GntR family transcriptional regulator n=1 Tax=Fictibacillus macauensis ZFHKF-1 TaxID=1196324 RepID=I8ALK6_9BACL|nr:FadR/GntR family transcriptional regulator [Fictibacillus macauensis]EIT86484.1 GntR family transcriptional regulator [Fictibacillus macauensis ZFHKF-1]